MIRVSSLDFLDQDCFRTDIKTADGKVIINSGEAVTPELILKLYFKEIYVEEPAKVVCTEEEQEKINISNTSKIEVSFVNKDDENKVDSDNIPEKAIEHTLVASSAVEHLDNAMPEEEKSIAYNKVENKELTKTSQVDYTTSSDNQKSQTQSTQSSQSDFVLEKQTKLQSGTNNHEQMQEDFNQNDSADNNTPGVGLIIVDENEVERLITRTVELAEEFNYSAEEIEEIKLAARYSNLALGEFRICDIYAKDFRLKKAEKSYDLACSIENLSPNVLDAIKNHTKNYDSVAFSLSKKIPYSDILSVTCYCFREKILKQEKENVLREMLQLGINSFNPFVLHKFIRMLREK